MGRIIMPPKPIVYKSPKAIGGGLNIADIVARAMLVEHFESFGDYCRVIDKLRWRQSNYEEIRFTYYYRKPNGTEKDWIYGQGAGHMSPDTLVKLIKKAKVSPDFGNFGNSLDAIII